MKAQFFLLSAGLLMSSFLTVAFLFKDFYYPDLSSLAFLEKAKEKIVIENALCNLVKRKSTLDPVIFQSTLDELIDELKNVTRENGGYLEISYIDTGSSIDFSFRLYYPQLVVEGSFSCPY